MRLKSLALATAIAAVALNTTAFAAGRGGGGGFHGMSGGGHTMSPPVTSMPRPGMPGRTPSAGGAGAAAAIGPMGPPIVGTVIPLPGNDSVTNCVHSAGVAGLSGTSQAGPFVHNCAF